MKEKTKKIMEQISRGESSIKKIAFHANKTANSKGFWDDDNEFIEYLQKNNQEKFAKVFNNYRITTRIALVITELGEAVEAVRTSERRHANMKAFTRDVLEGDVDFVDAFIDHLKHTPEEELADAVIRLFDMCEELYPYTWKIMFAKMAYNQTRGRKHGKKF